MDLNKEIALHQTDLQIHQYGFLKTSDLVFSEGVRKLCEMNSCGEYGKTWACPPGVGTLEECRERVLQYENVLVFTTLHQLEDSYDYEGMMDGKAVHIEISAKVVDFFRQYNPNIFILSAEGCARCKDCTYPDAPCRFPDTLYPSIESYCVEVNRVAKQAGINYINGANTVTYFSCILY